LQGAAVAGGSSTTICATGTDWAGSAKPLTLVVTVSTPQMWEITISVTTTWPLLSLAGAVLRELLGANLRKIYYCCLSEEF
jgi:hypothetical protein